MSSSAPPAAAPNNVQDLRPAGQTALQELLAGYPLVSFAITVVCGLVYASASLGDFNTDVADFAMCPAAAVFDLELYRLVTSAFVHLNILHIGMNMMTLFSMGTSLEGIFGSLHFFFLVLVYVLFCGLLYVLLAVLELAVWSPSGFAGCAAGFSGVLFALAVDESSLSTTPTRSVFGLFTVPTKLYPWALMLSISLFVPGVSFMGHLAGILVGGAHSSGWLGWCLPGLPTLRKLEELAWMRPVVRLRMYRLVPNSDPVLERNSSASVSTLSHFTSALAFLLAPLTQCLRGLWARVRRSGGATSHSPAAAEPGSGTPRFVPTAQAVGRASGSAEARSATTSVAISVANGAPSPIPESAATQPPRGGLWAALGGGTDYSRLVSTEPDGEVVHPALEAAMQPATAPPPPPAAAEAASARDVARAKAVAAAEARAAAQKGVVPPR